VVAWNNLVDVVHAQHIAEHPSTRILALKSGNHAVLTDLYRNGQAVAILSGYRGETMKGLVQVDPPCDRRDFEAIKAATFAELHRDWRSAIEWIEPVAKRYPHWAGPSFHFGRALLNRGEAARGREQLRRALSACPEWLAPSDQLCRALTQLGELTEAEHVLRKAIAVNEWWLSGKLQLAELLAYKDDEEARDVARGAEKGIRAKTRRHPRLPIAQRMLCRALQLQGRLDEAQAAALRAKELRVRLCASSP
jgi:tetratricopeptide (TPR) repeat protein